MAEGLNIAIVGAGVGGLSAAVALSARGMTVTVFEGAEEPREAGAGLSIPPNALILLNRTALCGEIEKITTRSQGLTRRTSRGEPISPGSPTVLSYQVHRVEFLEMLLGAVKGSVRFGHRCMAVEATQSGARLTFANGVVYDADVVIGADGIHSVVQRQIGLTAHPKSEGIVAYRGLVQSQKLSWGVELRGLHMWMGEGRSFICFPASQGRLINIVAFVPTMHDMEETWSARGDLRALAAEYESWDAPVRDLIAALEDTFRWGIYDRPPLPYWSRGHVTLLGDAAHPMVPHFGQGAAQAIEDAFALAVVLEHAKRDEIPARLKAYQDLRWERTSRVQAASRLAGRFYRSVGDSAQSQRLRAWMSAAEWIFPYDAEKAALAFRARSQLRGDLSGHSERLPLDLSCLSKPASAYEISMERAMKTGIATASILAATVLTAHAQMPRIEIYPITSVTLKDPELLAGRRDGQPVTIAGELRIPRTKTKTLPAVVLLHGSAGIAAWMEDWSKELHQLGIASFVVDSFSGRGIVTTVNDQAQLGRLNMVVDAYRALDVLAKHPRIDPSRIAVMGFSRGGQAAVYSAMNVLYETFGPANNLRFSAHIAFYPDCTTTYLKDGDVASKPIRILIGTEDNYSSIDACRSYVDRLAKGGKDATMIEYQGAHHNFDIPVFKTPVVSRGAITVRRCRLVEDNDHTIINRETQKPFTYSDACVGKDPTLAYDEAATNQARAFIREFLAQTLQ